MKLSIACAAVAANALFVSTEAGDVERRLARKGQKSTKRKDLIGDCSALSNTEFTIETSFHVTEKIIYTYPCSGGYLRNFASNTNLLTDVRQAITDAGKALGIDADCANLCELNNGSYATAFVTGAVSAEEAFKDQDVFCDADYGILNQVEAVDAGFGGPDACRCDPDGLYIAGCTQCSGRVIFETKTCMDSTDAPRKSPKSNSMDM